jgi:hypothetical protein
MFVNVQIAFSPRALNQCFRVGDLLEHMIENEMPVKLPLAVAVQNSIERTISVSFVLRRCVILRGGRRKIRKFAANFRRQKHFRFPPNRNSDF